MYAKIEIWKNKLPFLSEGDAKCLAEEYDFSGGQIENISRKIFLASLLFGKQYTLESVMEYCSQETLLNTKSKKIGF